ncbi:MAG: DUF1572 domain-containing protein [Chitinophagaceae bacterium]|nr:DUF1572 domain-containing protein [Chitinophagaceae bacterium]
MLSGHWIANTNIKEQLLGITREQTVHKVGTLNSIAALTFHVDYYLSGLLHVFSGGTLLIRDQYSFDLPPIPTEKEWKALVDDFLSNAEKFIFQVETMSESKRFDPFVDEKYGDYLRNIEDVIEHCYYHLGQISLIRKMISYRR